MTQSYNAPKAWYGVDRPVALGAGISPLLVAGRRQCCSGSRPLRARRARRSDLVRCGAGDDAPSTRSPERGGGCVTQVTLDECMYVTHQYMVPIAVQIHNVRRRVPRLINLLALFHRNTALPARLPSSGGAPRTSCVIPEPRLPKLHSCFPTDHSDVSPGVHPHRDLPSCHQPNGYRPRLDTMVSARAPHWRGAQAHAQWLLKRGCRLLLLLMVLTFDYPLPF